MEDIRIPPDWTNGYLSTWHEGRWLVPFGDNSRSAHGAFRELQELTQKPLACFMYRGSWFIGLKETNDARA
jgi:hypothetical protein